MGGFNYGGKGDGTSWSSERGSGPEPGGGDRGNTGNHDKGRPRDKPKPSQQQLSVIQANTVVRDKLANLIRAARIINPAAVIKIVSLSASGTLTISVTGINVDQASTLGLSGLLTGFKYDGGSVVVGDIETHIKIPDSVSQVNKTAAFNNILSKANDVVTAVPPRTVWERAGDYYGNNTPVSKYLRKTLISAYNRTVAAGGVIQGPRGNIRQNVQKMLDEDKRIAAQKAAADAENKTSEQDVLQKTSEMIADAGAKISEHLGDKYKSVADEIASNIKNFQGKTIRNFNDAMASLNKVISNPAMKIKQADKDALINAWKRVDAQNMANKLGNLSRGFKVTDLVMKIEKVREKSIIGYKTGNWGPLILEVESWVLSGIVSGVVLGLFACIASYFTSTIFLPTAIMILGILTASWVSSLINDKTADKINQLLIRPAY